MQNMVSMMNIIYDLSLVDWDGKSGVNGELQRKLTRMFRSKLMMSWAELLHAAVCGKLDLFDREDQVRPFYRLLTEKQVEQLKGVVMRLVSWKMWIAPADDEIDRILSDNKSEVKDWFKRKGLNAGYLMGAPE